MPSTQKEVFDSDLSTRVPSPVPTPVPGADADVATTGETTRSPSIIDGGNLEKGAEPNSEENAGEEEPKYPDGARLIFIVVALVLSIFLVALDMVSPPKNLNFFF